jgi:glyoxylase-like metal-dependent hydrolase (beta-lactamase superfamily II)
MSDLRAAVFVAKPIPFQRDGVPGHWSPTSCTLIYDSHSALLVDTGIEIEQGKELAAWIKNIAPGRVLETIYITHGHPDHWFGVPLILKEFPNAKVLATPGTIKHAKESVEPGPWAQSWGAWFGDRIYQPFTFPEPLPKDNKILLNGKWELQAIEVGHSDTHDTTILWVPDLKLVVAGDVIYGQVHQMLALATKREQRDEWLKAIDVVESLNPTHVIGGHQQAEEVQGSWNVAATRKYIQDFERLLAEVKARDGKRQDLFDEMIKHYGDRANPMVLRWNVAAYFDS